MPIPFLLAGLGIGAAILGAGGHISAKETNEKAQKISGEAKSLYNSAKYSLENAQGKTEKSLLELGYSKKNVLETSMKQFLIAWERIKHIELSESSGLDEIKNFTLDKKDALELREMADIYQSTFSSSVAGVATGAAISLAASGSLPIVTGVLSTAGTALMAGEVSAAAGLAGSALSFGAAMTPLAAIAAPVILFTGINSSIKADQNLEKAHTMYAEAELAAEKMKTSEILCIAIAKRGELFNALLYDLNTMFSQCTTLLEGVTIKHMRFFKSNTVDKGKLSPDEQKLLAITRSLAGAIKSVLDTPIVTAEGAISENSEIVCEKLIESMPKFIEEVENAKNKDYTADPIIAKEKNQAPISMAEATKILIVILVGVIVFSIIKINS